MKIAAAALCIALAAPAPAQAAPAGTQAAAQAAAPSEREAQLATVVAFLAPPELFTQMVVGGIDVVFRERLGREPLFAQVEATYPGARDAMMAAALDHARRAAPAAAADVQAETRAFWNARLTPADLRAFAALLRRPRFAAFSARPFRIAPGETVTIALERHFRDAGLPPADPEYAAFAATPSGRRVDAAMGEFQRQSQATFGPRFLAAARSAIDAGYRGANAHARSMGGEAIFAD